MVYNLHMFKYFNLYSKLSLNSFFSHSTPAPACVSDVAAIEDARHKSF